MKKWILLSSLILLLAAGCSSGPEMNTLRVAVLPVLDALPIHVAQSQGYFEEQGLEVEIISVSLDKPGQKQRWLDAIEKDKLDWHHVSNLRYFNDPVARTYNVNAIPATFILDEDGRIVAKKLRGQALEDQIASMLK